MALAPWSERCAQMSGPPQKMGQTVPDCTIGGNSPGVVYGLIENTPGNTPMNRAQGGLASEPGSGSYTGQPENPYSWINASGLFVQLGQMDPTNG